MHRRAVALLAALVCLAAGSPAPARASDITRDDLFGERYCEIIALRGEMPNVTATVYNTIGFNLCPAPWWDSLDPEAVKEQLGAFAVLLNGPRFWLIDSASTPQLGPAIEVSGEGLREVATITISSNADLAASPYTERTINRENTWRWNKGRRIYELLSPDGRRYVMQSFSQIIEPEQSRGDLRTLGSRLELPEGWSFRTRRLKKPLMLNAKGTATIIQDDLTNTYQRVC